MALYPEIPIPNFPYDLTENWKTIVSAFDSGKEQRRQKQIYAKYDMGFAYSVLSVAEVATLWNFYNARRGAYEAFYAYTPDLALWTGLYIGMGDGEETTFDIPGKNTAAQKIYIQDVEQTITDDYSILEGGGAEGADRVLFVEAPEVNAIITCDFAGRMRIRCRFEEDKLTKQNFTYQLFSTGIKLKGLGAL